MSEAAATARASGARGPGGVTRALAGHAAHLAYDALPQPLVDRIKQCVLDTLGVSIGASALAEDANIVVDYVSELGGKP